VTRQSTGENKGGWGQRCRGPSLEVPVREITNYGLGQRQLVREEA